MDLWVDIKLRLQCWVFQKRLWVWKRREIKEGLGVGEELMIIGSLWNGGRIWETRGTCCLWWRFFGFGFFHDFVDVAQGHWSVHR